VLLGDGTTAKGVGTFLCFLAVGEVAAHALGRGPPAGWGEVVGVVVAWPAALVRASGVRGGGCGQ
jgi:hypothetical protein